MREALIVPAAADVDVRQRSDSTTHSRLALTLKAHVPVLRTTPHSAHFYLYISYTAIRCASVACGKGFDS